MNVGRRQLARLALAAMARHFWHGAGTCFTCSTEKSPHLLSAVRGGWGDCLLYHRPGFSLSGGVSRQPGAIL